MSIPLQYQPFTYLAASKSSTDPATHTELYRFRVITGTLEPVTKVPAYEQGYDALAFRPADGLLYAMDHSAEKRDVLLRINPETGETTKHKVSNMPTEGMAFVLGDIAPDGSRYVIAGSDRAATVEIDLTQKEYSARPTAGVPGSGGHYDWAFHPIDKRLYAVDGDTGALLVFDLSVHDQKQVLKADALPKAKLPDGSPLKRSVYGAVFFSDKGVLYSIDSGGNVYSIDLSHSTPDRPIAGENVPQHETVGGGATKIEKGLIVMDAAGCVITPPIPPVYIHPLVIKAECKGASNKTWLPPDRTVSGYEYTWDLSLTAKDVDTGEEVDVRKFRIQFELPEGGEVTECSGLAVEYGEKGPHAMVYLKSTNPDHYLASGKVLQVRCLVFVSGEQLKKPELVNLSANRVP